MGSYSFERIAEFISHPRFTGDFRPEILKNRLALMGVKEVFEGDAISELGFPFRYYHPLDEAILMLHYFLTRSNQLPDSYIHINTIHVPTKEEENTLSFWKSPKAGLYLDLHSLIENNNQKRGHHGLIQRLFVFRDNAHLAFLEASGIGVVLEQQSIGIKTGFILTSRQEPQIAGMIKSGMVLIQLFHPDDALCEWAIGIDRVDAANQPYGNHLVCKWHAGRIHNPQVPEDSEVQANLKEYLRLFEFEGIPAKRATGNSSYYFAEDPTEFSELLRANFQVALRGIGAPEAHAVHYEEQFKVKTVPDTLKQLHEVLTRSKASKVIKAVDASSVRSTLRIHDADPNYRHWIRSTVNMAIKDPGVSLERVYILDLNPRKDDYKVFEQELMLYRDFLTNRVSSLYKVWPSEEMGGPDEYSPTGSAADADQNNIKLYVITKRAIQKYCETLRDAYRDKILSTLKEGGFIKTERQASTTGAMTRLITTYMRELDFLYTEQLLFNYKDYKGEPGQAIYDADLFVLGEHSESEPNVITFLGNDEFDARRRGYEFLFNLFKELSVCVLPPKDGDNLLPTADELESELTRIRTEYFKDLP